MDFEDYYYENTLIEKLEQMQSNRYKVTTIITNKNFKSSSEFIMSKEDLVFYYSVILECYDGESIITLKIEEGREIE